MNGPLKEWYNVYNNVQRLLLFDLLIAGKAMFIRRKTNFTLFQAVQYVALQ